MAREFEPKVVNIIHTLDSDTPLPFGTTNPAKLAEFSRILGYEVNGINLGEIDEIQSKDPLKVARRKAIDAYRANNGPVIVEDTSLALFAMNGLPGPYIKEWSNSESELIDLCQAAQLKNDRRAIATVTIAVYDGGDVKDPESVQFRQGITHGTIADQPDGSGGFDWDSIFIPNGQEQLPGWDGVPKTFGRIAEADPALKDNPILSMRTKALQKMKEEPFQLGKYVYELPEPYQFQINAIDQTLFDSEQNRTHAYALDMLGGMTHETFDVENLPGYYEIDVGEGFRRYVLNENQAGLGVVISPMDLATDLYNQPYRLQVAPDGRPVFWQPGENSIKMALAARALEFETYHNDEMYETLRAMMRGEIQTEPRSNQHSAAVEELIHWIKIQKDVDEVMDQQWEQEYEQYPTYAAAFRELAYARRYSPDTKMSRTDAAINGLFNTTSGIPSSVFGLGGMPPVTSSPDVLATAALSYMDCYITHNNIYAGDPERQIALFLETKEKIQQLGLPSDIEELVIAHVGLSVGSEDPEEIARTVQMFQDAGGSLVRVYTTNTDYRVPETAKLIREHMDATLESQGIKGTGQFGEKKMRICVGPIVDIPQAQRLIEDDIRVNIILAGHGGGENCTSLEGGGAANALELAYAISLLSEFNGVALGLEGGTGTSIGSLLGIVDLISLNRRGVAAGIETGGLYVEHTNGRVCLPYHGTASPPTQWTEAVANPLIAAKRVDRAGRLRNVEGKPNYMYKPRAINSIVDAFLVARMLAGRALADQQSRSINDLRKRIARVGFENHRGVSPSAFDVANHHRGN